MPHFPGLRLVGILCHEPKKADLVGFFVGLKFYAKALVHEIADPYMQATVCCKGIMQSVGEIVVGVFEHYLLCIATDGFEGNRQI